MSRSARPPAKFNVFCCACDAPVPHRCDVEDPEPRSLRTRSEFNCSTQPASEIRDPRFANNTSLSIPITIHSKMRERSFALGSPASNRRRRAAPETSGDPANPAGEVRVDHALRDIVRGLNEASSTEDMAKSLSRLGALFQMPHVSLEARKPGQVGRGEAVSSVSPSMRSAANALALPALTAALSKAGDPITLSDAEQGMGPDWRRPRELHGIEAVAATIEAAPDSVLYAVFFGRQGFVSGLSKSMLVLGTYLAAHRRAAASARPDALRAFTGRERQVIDLAKGGLTDAKIGKMLGIATRTVRFHVGNAMRKSGAETRAQLIAKSSQRTLKK